MAGNAGCGLQKYMFKRWVKVVRTRDKANLFEEDLEEHDFDNCNRK